MNITEKILARGSSKSKLEPGEIIFAKVDKIMLHDVSGPGVIKVFDKLKKEGDVSVDKLAALVVAGRNGDELPSFRLKYRLRIRQPE